MNSYSNINTNDTLCQPPRAPTQNETIIFNAFEVINFRVPHLILSHVIELESHVINFSLFCRYKPLIDTEVTKGVT